MGTNGKQTPSRSFNTATSWKQTATSSFTLTLTSEPHLEACIYKAAQKLLEDPAFKMKRSSISATPCPAPTNGFSSHRFSLSSCTTDDTTTQIDYTRAFEPTLRNTKPRRRSSLAMMAKKDKAPMKVFEDVKEDEELVISKATGKSTLFAQPARKMAVGGSVADGGRAEQRADVLRENGLGNRRLSMGGGAKVEPKAEKNEQKSAFGGMTGRDRKKLNSEDIFGPAKKNPRRMTIFIPEDTTFDTIHPGADTTARLDDTFNIPALANQLPAQQVQPTEERESQLSKPMRRPRMSLSAAPKRGVLALVKGPENVDGFDACGANTGEENYPPMARKIFNQAASFTAEGRREAERLAAIAEGRAPRRITTAEAASTSDPVHPAAPRAITWAHQDLQANPAPPVATQPTTFAEPTAATQNRQVNTARPAVPLPTALSRAPRFNVPSRTTTANKRPDTSSYHSIQWNPRLSFDGPRRRPERIPSPRFSPKTRGNNANEKKSSLRQHMDMRRLELQASNLSLYPVLQENFSQPELYEDHWLSQQEVALTEITNEILAAAQRNGDDSVAAKSLREALLTIYHQPEVAILHKRLQASLLYGAFSKPKTSSTSSDPARDIGLRKKFISLFLETYDEETLRAAAELVVGRQIPKRQSVGDAKGIASSEEILDPRAGRRALTGFLETFFVSPADIDFAEYARAGDDSDHETIRWRKSILRCVMLIWLLDLAKEFGFVKGCLFKRTSAQKSSAEVLTAFAAMMMPSVGDIVRTMKQFDYELRHVQDPLDEVVYHVENLATDLRDGIFLTRLVEILLYNRKAITAQQDEDNTTITIQMPDSTQLSSDIYLPDAAVNTKLLSQHIKMPCTGRTQKVFNAQIALSALEGHSVDGANVVGDISADDIVNGHREKTLSLLWSLVSTFGLKHLVDLEYVAIDTQRANGAATGPTTLGLRSSVSKDPEQLLQQWATACAAKAGVYIANLTTSFADGKAYAAILDAFSTYIPATDSSSASARPKAILEARLTALGCSTAFTKQITSSVGNIPSRQTTVSNLAFLASRLLPLAREHHAVLTIQRAYRKHRAPAIASQRIALMRLASHCAKVVQTQQRAQEAATTIQRAWRGVLDARINKLSNDVTAFQALARGWADRRKLRGDGASTGRIMGGW